MKPPKKRTIVSPSTSTRLILALGEVIEAYDRANDYRIEEESRPNPERLRDDARVAEAKKLLALVRS